MDTGTKTCTVEKQNKEQEEKKQKQKEENYNNAKEPKKEVKEKGLECSTHQSYYDILKCDGDDEEDIEEELDREDDISERLQRLKWIIRQQQQEI